ncbi:hypothetical protein B0H63DRAFT_280559 [Podospora didyma]|uniref:Uncharacterized protein n=1 Tax=Podospora didyma TaxID=330526 RepID=A0AAE0KEY3_9PEZI|nr:hypothetical protein B0H63DRAFT_280559 [Podospora didyma]
MYTCLALVLVSTSFSQNMEIARKPSLRARVDLQREDGLRLILVLRVPSCSQIPMQSTRPWSSRVQHCLHEVPSIKHAIHLLNTLGTPSSEQQAASSKQVRCRVLHLVNPVPMLYPLCRSQTRRQSRRAMSARGC